MDPWAGLSLPHTQLSVPNMAEVMRILVQARVVRLYLSGLLPVSALTLYSFQELQNLG